MAHPWVEEWEQRGRYLDVDDRRVFVLDAPPIGEAVGDPIFVLHGFPTCSFDWRMVLDRLRAGRRVVLFDFLGFGLSDKPDYRYSIRSYADTAQAVAQAHGLERVALVTHDMGDTVGGELLARDLDGTLPFGVSQRVITNGSIYIEMANLTAGQEMLLDLDDARIDLAALGIDPSDAFQAGVAATFAVAPDREELAAQWDLVSRHDGHKLLPRTIRYIEDRRAEESRFTGAIETHPSPLAIVWGALDPVAVHAMAMQLHDLRPDAPLTTLEDIGHYPMVEAPTEFADAVCDALAAPS